VEKYYFRYTTKKGEDIILPLNGWVHAKHTVKGSCSISHSNHVLFESTAGANVLDNVWEYLIGTICNCDNIQRVTKTGELIEIALPVSMLKNNITVL
jgi:hypothetical protein